MSETFWRTLTADEAQAAAADAGVRLSFERYGFDLGTHSTPTSRHLAAMRAERRRVAQFEYWWRLSLSRYLRAVKEAEAEFGPRILGTFRR